LLSGFFDGTAAPENGGFAGVAGYLFDDAGLSTFRESYAILKDEYKREYGYDVGVFHATYCCGSRGFRTYQHWLPEMRQRLCREIATLSSSLSRAGFLSTVRKSDFDSANAFVREKTGGPYPMALFACLERVGRFAQSSGDEVFLWFEHGDTGQAFAEAMLRNVQTNPELRRHYGYFDHTVVPKDHPEAIALIAADSLGWHCKQNFVELLRAAKDDQEHDDSRLSENFKLHRGTDPRRWLECHTIGAGWDVRALMNTIMRLS
jgi:hypothetical protein